MKKQVIAISGIDTDIGKTVATGVIARSLLEQGYKVFTQKMVQTGCVGISEDILLHRQLMGIELTEEDKSGLSCPYLFSVPCSPHLAAELDGVKIEPEEITKATKKLLDSYDILLLEGAGGLAVPLTLDYTFVDYLQQQNYPVVLVSSPRLGSINHTVSALEILRSRNVNVAAIIYNLHGFMENTKNTAAMVADSRRVMLHYLQKLHKDAEVIDFPSPPELNSIQFHSAVRQMLLSF